MPKMVLTPWGITQELKNKIKGEIKEDKVTRYLYSTDASVYRIQPSCVVYPKDKNDVIEIIKFAYENKIPIHPRGAGSGLGGASLGSGIVIAFRRYMNQILEIKENEEYTRVQSGVICGDLNHELAKIGKIMYVDNSSENYAAIGGMIGTNSSGAHAVKYGYMADYVKELTVILSNGEEITTHPIEIGSAEYQQLTSADTLEAKIYKSIVELANNPELQSLILEKWPKVKMNVSGYNLKEIVVDNRVDLSKLILGSEGTLGLVVEAKLRFIDKPKNMTLMLLDFDSLTKSGRAVDLIVNQIGVAAIEILDKSVLEIGVAMNPALKEYIPEGIDNILYVECDNDDPAIRSEKVKKVKELILDENKLAIDMRYSDDPEEQANLWKVRKDAVPLLQKNS